MTNDGPVICILCGTEYKEPVEVCDVCANARFLRSAEGAVVMGSDPAFDAEES